MLDHGIIDSTTLTGTVPITMNNQNSENFFFSSLRALHHRHERLKKYVHEGFRYPLPKWGRAVMGFVYFTIPIVGGWHLMQWAISKSEARIGKHGEYLPVKEIQGFGNKRIVVDHDQNKEIVRLQTVGAGGWGGGVRLVVSDAETQKKNTESLMKYLKKQQKRLKKKKNGTDTQEVQE